MKNIKIEDYIIREQISSRGGGVEIDLTNLGYDSHKMTAYQNYLGGGMLGKVCNDCTMPEWRTDAKLMEIAEALRKYFFNQTNPETEWESQTFEQNQNMPISAYSQYNQNIQSNGTSKY